jgi:hypothetical protein
MQRKHRHQLHLSELEDGRPETGRPAWNARAAEHRAGHQPHPDPRDDRHAVRGALHDVERGIDPDDIERV